jgi:predicted  nucleic acid-binding Zn ribbon protein
LRFLFERITQARTFVRRVESNTNFCSLERSTRNCCMNRNSNWVFNSRIKRSFEISNWIKTCRFVRIRTLN